MTARCECCDLPLDQCGREAEARQTTRAPTTDDRGPIFEARYFGACGGDCGDRIQPGDPVRYAGDVLCHEECAR